MFNLGQILATPGAMQRLEDDGERLHEVVQRHSRLEQGSLCDEDHQQNVDALLNGSRIFSCFRTKELNKIWVITEAEDDQGDRCATTVLLPEEY